MAEGFNIPKRAFFKLKFLEKLYPFSKLLNYHF